jgi:hypothetical protein
MYKLHLHVKKESYYETSEMFIEILQNKKTVLKLTFFHTECDSITPRKKGASRIRARRNENHNV